ncbi:hypothetical protein DESUT3_24770 [Desulfuromonas versatilis]|uniref:DUF3311 domain-containing protein n=1 Tax=Desulfuromonas versatilis TaxID=2802975 RepID=A0ABM8HWA2_9BACT|nr:hypothetical protein [Desulfuromonas versatilis]BCR05408.1 hypothetical protein DESUT3_24770 [Desulfuromonas versatilis]
MKGANPSHIRQAWLFFFLLGVVMLNYPMIHIFNKITLIIGVPALVLYFMIGWPASIAVIYIFCRKIRASDAEDSGEPPGDNQE